MIPTHVVFVVQVLKHWNQLLLLLLSKRWVSVQVPSVFSECVSSAIWSLEHAHFTFGSILFGVLNAFVKPMASHWKASFFNCFEHSSTMGFQWEPFTLMFVDCFFVPSTHNIVHIKRPMQNHVFEARSSILNIFVPFSKVELVRWIPSELHHELRRSEMSLARAYWELLELAVTSMVLCKTLFKHHWPQSS